MEPYKTQKEMEEQYQEHFISSSISYQPPQTDYDMRIGQNGQGKNIEYLLPEWILSLEAILRKIYNRKKAMQFYSN